MCAYTSGNPISRTDPSDLLVQFDQNSPSSLALMIAYANTGATLQYQVENSPFIWTITNLPTGTILNSYYLNELSDQKAAELLDTIIHEAIHYTYPPTAPQNIENDAKRTGYPYDEAKRRTTKALIDKLNKLRKIKKPNPKQCPT
jgi:hypothetical protein